MTPRALIPTSEWNTSHDAMEIAYCEDCNKFTPWHTTVALNTHCICGSTRIARGTTGVGNTIKTIRTKTC